MDPSKNGRMADALASDFRVRQLVQDRPVRRDLTCVNVERRSKESFDRVVAIDSARLGRSLTQWEGFALLVAEAEERYGFELGAMRGR